MSALTQQFRERAAASMRARSAWDPHAPTMDDARTEPSMAHVVREGSMPVRPVRVLPEEVTPEPEPEPELEPPAPCAVETAEEVLAAVALEGHVLNRAARRLYGVLHALAASAVRAWKSPEVPGVVAMHLPAILLAYRMGWTDRHLRRICAALEKAELLDFGGHVAEVGHRTMYGGTLYGVRVRSSGGAARLTEEDWRYEWRDFEGDLKAGRTACREMSELSSRAASPDEVHQALEAWAVARGANRPSPPPVVLGSDISGGTLLDCVSDVSALGGVAWFERPRVVGSLAGRITRALGDVSGEWRAWWCGALWEALRGGQRGLEVLRGALERLRDDLREGAPWRNPGAVFARRWRPLVMELEGPTLAELPF